MRLARAVRSIAPATASMHQAFFSASTAQQQVQTASESEYHPALRSGDTRRRRARGCTSPEATAPRPPARPCMHVSKLAGCVSPYSLCFVCVCATKSWVYYSHRVRSRQYRSLTGADAILEVCLRRPSAGNYLPNLAVTSLFTGVPRQTFRDCNADVRGLNHIGKDTTPKESLETRGQEN